MTCFVLAQVNLLKIECESSRILIIRKIESEYVLLIFVSKKSPQFRTDFDLAFLLKDKIFFRKPQAITKPVPNLCSLVLTNTYKIYSVQRTYYLACLSSTVSQPETCCCKKIKVS